MASRSLPLVIVNPASRGGSGADDWRAAAGCVRRHFGPYEVRVTEGPGHASDIAREEADSGRPLVLTFGGDGTISEAARGILSSGAPCELGVLPNGTGSDFARSLSMPKRLADAARRLRRGATRTIDVGLVTFSDGSSRRFVNSASLGLSAEVAHRANRGSKSVSSYAEMTVRAALAYGFPEVELRVDDRAPRRLRVTTVSLHNGRYFGAGMKMAPGADLTDGRLEAVIVRKLPLARLLGRAPLLYLGAHLGLEEVESGSVSALEARAVSAERVRVEVDGECPGTLPARFEVERRALRIRWPGRVATEENTG